MASSSRADELAAYSSTDDEGANPHRSKRRKGPKACDVCRRKKIRCDPSSSGDMQSPCVNCAVFRTECTYTYVAKKRRTQQAYIDSLQNRLSKLERLIVTMAPQIDISKELDDNTARPSLPRPPSPLKRVPRPRADNVKPSDVIAAFTEWRDSNDGANDESEDEVTFISAPGNNSKSTRFLGTSSGIPLIQRVIGMKRESTEGEGMGRVSSEPFTAHHPETWETRVNDMPPPMFTFPETSLVNHLLPIFFRCVNTFLPLLHRPTFEADFNDRRHERDPGFGGVLLLICAIASRWSDDERVLPKVVREDSQNANENFSWSSAGWDFYWQVHQRYRRNLMQSTSVCDLQIMALSSVYLQGTYNSSSAWQSAGLGIRMAIEVGVHRKKRPGTGCVLDAEMWKRAFWCLVLLDRMGSSGLGRPCAIWEEDIDLDLPLEVDDEYLNPEASFTQPPSKPSQMAFFNSSVKLSQILIGALRTIYPVSRSKSIFRLVGPTWEQDMVASLDSSLNSWLDSIPEHLRWDPHSTSDDLTFYQAVSLHSSYNYVQIVVHRPYITPSRSRKPSAGSLNLVFPSLAICTNAARSCSHILDACLRRGTMMMPQLNQYAFTAAVVLLFNLWGMNKPGTAVRLDWEKQMQDVHICMRFIKRSAGRHYSSTKLGHMLRDLVFVGDLPLPGASPPACPDLTGQGQKRTRDEENTPDLDTGLETAATSPSSGLEYTLGNQNQGHIFQNDPHNLNCEPDPRHGKGRPEFDQHQNQQAQFSGPHMGEHERLNMGEMLFKLPNQAQSGQLQYQSMVQHPPSDQWGNTPQTQWHGQERHSSDVLATLDTAYLTGDPSMLADSLAMDVANAWGNAPAGFEWDEWQQFMNAVQNAPPGTGGNTGLGTEPTLGEQPLMWAP